MAALLAAAFASGTAPQRAAAQAYDTVLDTQFENLDFSSPVRESGADRAEGTVYFYDDIYASGGTTVNARITIVDLNGATLNSPFDGTTNAARFEPTITTTSNNGYAELRIDLYDQDENRVAIQNFAVTGVDIDGESGSQEFHEVTGMSSYRRDSSTQLVITPGSPYTRFRGRTSSLSGITFDNTAAYIAEYTAPVTSFTFRLGNTGTASGRLFSIALGAPGGVFSNPITVSAPSVVLTTPNTTVNGSFVTTATFSQGVGGLTQGEIVVTNGTVLAGSLASVSTSVYTFTVVPTAPGSVTVRVPNGSAQSISTTLDNTNSNTLAVSFDNDPPDTDIANPEPNPTNDPTAEFTFTSDETPVTFECRIGAAPFVSCSASHVTASLNDGTYTIEARAIDEHGNVDSTPASYTWTLDRDLPDTFITNPEPSPTSDDTAEFTFTSDESPVTFECRIGAAAFGPCNASHVTASLPDGTYTIEARATDAAGNVDDTPASTIWTVDRTRPDTFITNPEPSPTNDDTAEFTFTSNESPVTFECRIGAAAFGPCNASHTTASLPDGTHTIEARATDASGNVDDSPASYTWTIDRDRPTPVLTTNEDPADELFPVTITFDEAVTGFERADITIAGGTITEGPSSNDGDVSFLITISRPIDTEVTIHIAAEMASDLTGNLSFESNRLVVNPQLDDDVDGTFSGTDPDDSNPCVPDDLVPVCDGDGDGLPDGREDGTAADNADTDGDGLCDGPVAVIDVCEAGEDLDGDGDLDEDETDPRLADTDLDGLGDGLEVLGENPTDPLKPDTDQDDLCDGPAELEGCMGAEDADADGAVGEGETDPNNPDTDGDGIDDGTETYGVAETDPLDPDTDDDRLCDGPASVAGCTGGEDMNADGLLDDGETDPTNADTDGGGVPDGEELLDNGTDPNEGGDDVPDTDRDNDGIPNVVEDATGTDADDPDTDGDGLCDGPLAVEGVCVGGEDINANGVVDMGETDPTNSDTDADGLGDGTEQQGANPTNPLDPDTDGDGLCDGPVALEGVCPAGEDENGNGAWDAGETDPNNTDTDSGGLNDGDELTQGGNALDNLDDVPAPVEDEWTVSGGSLLGCTAAGTGAADAGWLLLGMAFVCGSRWVRRRARA